MSDLTSGINPTSLRPAISEALLRYVRGNVNGVVPAEWHKLNIAIEALRSTSRTLVVQFVGPARQVGTTIVASGFATAAAQSLMGNRSPAAVQTARSVLLVDCDFPHAKPRRRARDDRPAETLLQAFHRDDSLGTILGAPIIHGVVRARLGVIDDNGAPRCGAEELTRLFEAVRDRFSLVVLDSPPAEVNLASLLLAARCDGTLMVVRAAVTKSNALQSTRQEIEQAGGRVIGVVFNRAGAPGRRRSFGLRS